MESISSHLASFDPVLALAIFAAYVIIDALYAYYTLSVTQYHALSAATSGLIIHLLLAFGVINYIGNYLYVFPLALGSWVGTYIMVRREKRKSL
ncbi:MAG: hypothetical protein Q8O53_01115 [Candidatus Moranbacteria bacterium]|nr:hypothetical protein [Candidatus Moranbacteria bacterium]